MPRKKEWCATTIDTLQRRRQRNHRGKPVCAQNAMKTRNGVPGIMYALSCTSCHCSSVVTMVITASLCAQPAKKWSKVHEKQNPQAGQGAPVKVSPSQSQQHSFKLEASYLEQSTS
eukprot:1159586-Pelagomonas_calceolata.AAC.10